MNVFELPVNFVLKSNLSFSHTIANIVYVINSVCMMFEYEFHGLSFYRAQKVCQLWAEVSCHPKLWKKVDLSFGFLKLTQNNFKKLCADRFSECQQLNLTNCKVTSDISAIKVIVLYFFCQYLNRIIKMIFDYFADFSYNF